MIKHGSKFINAVSNSGVPHITILMGASYGAGTLLLMADHRPPTVGSRSLHHPPPHIRTHARTQATTGCVVERTSPDSSSRGPTPSAR
jgi:hypothetical protein